MKICQKSPNLYKNRQIFRALYMKILITYILFLLEILKHRKTLSLSKLYQAVRVAEEVKTLRVRLAVLRFTYIVYDVV
jgi:hypothetical protein